VKEGYEWRRLTEGGGLSFYLFWKRVLLDFWGGSFGFAQFESVVGRISTGGTGLLGVLGTGARISIWYPGARKLS
jgi:hypothetical protein